MQKYILHDPIVFPDQLLAGSALRKIATRLWEFSHPVGLKDKGAKWTGRNFVSGRRFYGGYQGSGSGGNGFSRRAKEEILQGGNIGC